jgi:hypothetical protein
MDSDRLYTSAERFAGLALRDFAEDRYDMAVLHAGVMLEHLAKAYLAWLHPSFIVEAGSFDSLLLACGHEQLATNPNPGALRTIGLSAAVKRLAQIVQGGFLTGAARAAQAPRGGPQWGCSRCNVGPVK